MSIICSKLGAAGCRRALWKFEKRNSHANPQPKKRLQADGNQPKRSRKLMQAKSVMEVDFLTPFCA
ncbi:MAG: hypothetical protein ACR652_08075 [Methylocystis sp.]|uniref:hypothetical protein n=1 Tax=Methylocystis sp. TaxID=1911079 RepID=UPI003DA5E5FE